MANEIRQYTLTVPAATPSTAPVTLNCSFPPRRVDALQIVVPPGPAGLVGWRVLCSGVPIIPYASDAWIVTAGEVINWPLIGQPDSGSWQVQGYNAGTVAHSVYVRFLLSLVPAGGGPGPNLIYEPDLGSGDYPLFGDGG